METKTIFMGITKLYSDFVGNDKSAGITLIICTILSIIIANSAFHTDYHAFWSTQLPLGNLEFWINDGLMAIFFLFVGLELKREIYTGELSNVKAALLPIFAAIGGVLVPAGIFMFFNYGTPTQAGAGIPMATDIAFALGVLTLLGNRVPLGMKIFLTALAVIDDLMAIVVIGIFYTSNFSLVYLLGALGVLGILGICNKFKVNSIIIYLIGGVIAWYLMLQSGVHATIAGVVLAFTIPFSEKNSLSEWLEHKLAKPVAFLILPLFALANTAIEIDQAAVDGLTHVNSIGIFLGLVVGKPLGIFVFSLLVISLGICKLPTGVRWIQLFSVACLAGIGFTMSIFITNLAFTNHEDIVISKMAILISSTLAALIGYVFLSITLAKSNAGKIEE